MKKAALLPILVVAYLMALVLALAPSAEAQQPKKVPRIGYLSSVDPAGESVRAEGIRLALRERGYIEGQNIRAQAQSRSSKRDIQIRQHFMERSFAQAKRFGFKRARWRGQWRVQIQDYLVAVVQNIQLLIAHGCPGPRAAVPAGSLMAMGKVVFVFLPSVSLMSASERQNEQSPFKLPLHP